MPEGHSAAQRVGAGSRAIVLSLVCVEASRSVVAGVSACACARVRVHVCVWGGVGRGVGTLGAEQTGGPPGSWGHGQALPLTGS